jgi:RimJ/RimL family protein N-acetyltransferase
MTTREDLIYRQVFTLRDGTRVLVRPLTVDDRQALLELFLPVPLEDKTYMRHDVSNPEVIHAWIDHLDYEKVLPLVAEVNHKLVGEATLHFREGPARHRAEVRIFLAKEFRQRGVGSRMLQALIELAKRRDMHMLEVEVASDQPNMIKAFRKLGFETRAVLEDYCILPDGDFRDVTLLTLRLRAPDHEF